MGCWNCRRARTSSPRGNWCRCGCWNGVEEFRMTAPRLFPPMVAAGRPSPLALARSAAAALQARPIVAALASAVLLWASHFPLNFAPLAWVALVPVLTLVRSTARPWVVYLCAWIGGLAFFVP